MRGYYSGRLSGERLRRCYDIASPRVQRYLEAEVRFVLGRLQRGDAVLELGCGYGRVAFRLAEVARRVVGIDTSPESIALARCIADPGSRCEFLPMDARSLAFDEAQFDAVVCVQNGVCAFGLDPEQLVREALRVAKPTGRVLFSTYSDRFWTHRLEWFEAQAAAGLVGTIDRERTGNGTIVCEDGFHAGTMSPDAFRSLAGRLGVEATITEVDESSVFCEMAVPESSVTLSAFDRERDAKLLEGWLRRPHVVRWWGEQVERLTTFAERPGDSHALIVADGRPVGYVCWQRLSRHALEVATLTDLPEDLVDIDILIGEPDHLGRGIGPRALGLLLARLRDEGVSYAGLATLVENRAALRAYDKAGFRLFREFDDPESGPCKYLLRELANQDHGGGEIGS